MKWILVIGFLCLAASLAKAETCLASVYGTRDKDQNGSSTASGIPLVDSRATVAHKTYRLRGWLRITNRKTGKVIVAQNIDRGPYVVGRCVDLSQEAAKRLGVGLNSLTEVVVQGER